MSEWVELGREGAKNLLVWMLAIIVFLGGLYVFVKTLNIDREDEVRQYKCNKEKGIYLKQYSGYVCVKQGEIIWKRTM